MSPLDHPYYRAFMGVCTGISFFTTVIQIIRDKPLGLILFDFFLTIFSGYWAFHRPRGAEDDSGKGCQS